MEKKIIPIYPNSQFKSFCYIKSVITRPNIIAGDYSYYDDSEDGPESFEKHVTHHYEFMGDKLTNNKFITHKFIMMGHVFFKRFWTFIHIIIVRIITHDNVWSSDYTFDITKCFELRVWINWLNFLFHINMLTKK